MFHAGGKVSHIYNGMLSLPVSSPPPPLLIFYCHRVDSVCGHQVVGFRQMREGQGGGQQGCVLNILWELVLSPFPYLHSFSLSFSCPVVINRGCLDTSGEPMIVGKTMVTNTCCVGDVEEYVWGG